MLYAGLDLSRKRLDFHLLDAEGATVEVGASPPDVDGLRGLTQRLERHGAHQVFASGRADHPRPAALHRSRPSLPQDRGDGSRDACD